MQSRPASTTPAFRWPSSWHGCLRPPSRLSSPTKARAEPMSWVYPRRVKQPRWRRAAKAGGSHGREARMTLKPAIALAILGVSGRLSAQVQGRVGAALPQVQVERPATGLALHDFLYAGESHERNIYIVRGEQDCVELLGPGSQGRDQRRGVLVEQKCAVRAPVRHRRDYAG